MAVCVVSGASGLVGTSILEQLFSSRHQLHAWQTNARYILYSRKEKWHSAGLGETPIEEIERLLKGADVFIHCAWDLKVATWRDIERVNVNGSIAWFEAAARCGVNKLIFVSSVSAYPGCRSMYGRSKLLVEAAVTRLGGVNVRPGIVHGDTSAGVYGRLWKSTSASFIPLIDGGHQRMLTVHREDLALAIDRIVDDYDQWKGRTIAVGHPELVTLRGMLERMLAARGRRGHFVTVPSLPVMFALRCAERAGVRLQFRSDSLVTLIGEEPRVDRDVLQELKISFRSLDDALKL